MFYPVDNLPPFPMILLFMDTIPVTRAYLESLTTSDLLRMADNCGIDIPPDLDRVFIIEEVLELSSQDDVDLADITDPGGAVPAPSDVSETPDREPSVAVCPVPEAGSEDSDLNESVPLPKQYNITFIEVMIRDPLWAFVFWEIKTSDKEQFEKAQDFDGYYLKVSSWLVPEDKANETDSVFTVPVKPDDTAWYLGFSPPENGKSRMDQNKTEQRQYKVELCAGRRGDETVLAVSNPFTLPLLRELPNGAEGRSSVNQRSDVRRFEIPAENTGVGGNSLARLSGYGDFHILHNNERLFRVKRGSSAGSYE